MKIKKLMKEALKATRNFNDESDALIVGALNGEKEIAVQIHGSEQNCFFAITQMLMKMAERADRKPADYINDFCDISKTFISAVEMTKSGIEIDTAEFAKQFIEELLGGNKDD